MEGMDFRMEMTLRLREGCLCPEEIVADFLPHVCFTWDASFRFSEALMVWVQGHFSC